MWSLDAVLDRRSASMLGVGHFAVPPDVIAEPADAGRSAKGEGDDASSIIRTIVVPHGITAVPRRAPGPAPKRTPWRPLPERTVIHRSGGREWFTDRLFVESKQAQLPAACCTSAMAHATVVVVIVLLLLTARGIRPDVMPRSGMDVSLRMPPIELLLPIAVAPAAIPRPVHRSLPATTARMARPAARAIEAAASEAPLAIEAEPTTTEDAPIAAAPSGDGAGTPDGVIGGIAGSALSVEPVAPLAATGPLRVGEGVERPRKIKDVRPVYPPPAMAARVGGNVIIEATIGADGKVHNARVLRSNALLDQAALDAVRQWEFEPSRVNGDAVAVTMVIVVTFALL